MSTAPVNLLGLTANGASMFSPNGAETIQGPRSIFALQAVIPVSSSGQKLYKINARTGALRWSVDVLARYFAATGIMATFYGVGAVDQKRVYLTGSVTDISKYVLAAVDVNTGEILWTQIGGKDGNTPEAAAFGNMRVAWDGMELDAATGAIINGAETVSGYAPQVDYDAAGYRYIASDPAINGAIYKFSPAGTLVWYYVPPGGVTVPVGGGVFEVNFWHISGLKAIAGGGCVAGANLPTGPSTGQAKYIFLNASGVLIGEQIVQPPSTNSGAGFVSRSPVDAYATTSYPNIFEYVTIYNAGGGVASDTWQASVIFPRTQLILQRIALAGGEAEVLCSFEMPGIPAQNCLRRYPPATKVTSTMSPTWSFSPAAGEILNVQSFQVDYNRPSGGKII